MPYRFLLSLVLVFTSTTANPAKKYIKQFYPSGSIKAKGWVKNDDKEGFWKFYYKTNKLSEQGHFKDNKKEKYWYFYNQNGKPLKQGHFKNDKKIGWWLFYAKNGTINHKCQLVNGVKNGYCLKYKNEKITSAEKYKNGKKIKEWFSFKSFREENSISDLK